MKNLRSSFLLLIAIVAVMMFVPSQKLLGQLYSFRARDMRLVFYTKAHEYIVPHIARCFENSLGFHRKAFDYTPSEPVTVILQDFGDFASGGANTVPFNLMGIGIAPFDYVYETMPAEERMNLMMIHELAHIAAMDKASPRDRFFRSLFFGKVAPVSDSPPSMLYAYLTAPRWYAPRWFIESIAVFMETWMAGGLGRALGAYDEMVFRTMVRDSSYIYDVVGLEAEGTKVDFQVGANSYLYGTRFVSYLALHHGPDKLMDWFRQTDSSKSYFASQFEHVYGTSLDEEWQQWIGWERTWQRTNLDSIRRYPLTPYRAITNGALGSVSRAYYDPATEKLIAAINFPGQTPHLAAFDVRTGSVEKLHEIRDGALFYVTSLAHDPVTHTLFYSTDNNHWRDLNSLNLKTGESRLLMKDARTGDFSFSASDSSLWGVRHFNGISTIVRIPFPYEEWNQVYSFDYGKDVFDIDISPDGKSLIGAVAEVTGRQSLVRWNVEKLRGGDTSYEVVYDFGNSTPANFVFSPDGRFLFGSSYYSGVSNIVRYDMNRKKMEWISNAESGFFGPVSISNDSVIAFHYTAKGFVPVMIPNRSVEDISAIKYLGQEVVEKYPALESWALKPPSPELVQLDSTETTGEYRPMGNIQLASAYPIVEGFKKFPAYGMRLNLSDPTLIHSMDITLSYSPNRLLQRVERFHANLNYSFWEWKVSGSYNGGDFYDLFGPTRSSRKGYFARVQYKNYLINDEPEVLSYALSLATYGDLERLPDFQNVATSFDRFDVFNIGLSYADLNRSLGAVDNEEGFQWQVGSYTTHVNKKLFPRFNANLAYGFLLPLDHSSIWLRVSSGYSPGDRGEPFANFFFGGFGNNWIDHQDIRRYREYYSFPGVELNSIGGTTYGKGMVEWTLPPLRFRRLGFTQLYCNWARLALFSTGIVVNPDSKPDRRTLLNAGGQLDFRLVIISSLEATLSLGYAGAFERGQRTDTEFMVSLRIPR